MRAASSNMAGPRSGERGVGFDDIVRVCKGKVGFCNLRGEEVGGGELLQAWDVKGLMPLRRRAYSLSDEVTA